MKVFLDQDKKLCVTFRLEPGCLGPQGVEYITDFCESAQKTISDTNAEFVILNIMPRHDKTLPEIEYKINNKKLSHDKAVKYLNVFDKNLDEFEACLQDKLAIHIDEYLGY